jgi:hypothetical protein
MKFCACDRAVPMLGHPDKEARHMAGIDDVEHPNAWRSYKNNRYASLGARRILRILRAHFRTHRHEIRREEFFRRYALDLFEDLNAAGAFALLHCGVAEENAQATLERENRRRAAKGLGRLATPEELEAELEQAEERARETDRKAQRAADQAAAEARRERRRMQLEAPWNRGRRRPASEQAAIDLAATKIDPVAPARTDADAELLETYGAAGDGAELAGHA